MGKKMKNKYNPVIFNNTFWSKKEKRRDVIFHIIGHIKKSGYSISYDDPTLELIIDEAVTNAMEHGNKWDPNRKVSVSLYEKGGDLCLSIEDEGAGFDTDKRIPTAQHMNPRGRGLQILFSLTEITWNKKGNRIVMKLTD